MRVLNKYQVALVDAGEDAYIAREPSMALTLSTDVMRYSNWFTGHNYKTYIDHLLTKLHAERSHTYIVGLSIYDAATNMNSFISDSANKYGPILKELTDSVLELAIRFTEQETVDTEKDETTTIQDAAATDQDSRSSIELTEHATTTDSALRKRNDTPQAGNNPNLTNDTYLSQSERNEAILGAREISNDIEDTISKSIGERLRTIRNIADPGVNYRTTVKMMTIPHIASLIDSIHDIYNRWLEELPVIA